MKEYNNVSYENEILLYEDENSTVVYAQSDSTAYFKLGFITEYAETYIKVDINNMRRFFNLRDDCNYEETKQHLFLYFKNHKHNDFYNDAEERNIKYERVFYSGNYEWDDFNKM